MYPVGHFAPFVEPDQWLARDPSQINALLETWGVCVVRGLFPSAECPALVASLIQELKTATDGEVDLNDPSTYGNYYDLFQPMKGMLCHHNGVGHLQTLDTIRRHPAFQTCFETIWPGQALASSVDGCSFHVPFGKRGTMETSKTPGVLHTDQSQTSTARCIQGLVNLVDVSPGGATFACIPGAFRHHAHVSGSDKKDWHAYTPEDTAYFATQGFTPVSFLLQAGDIVLWNSKTPHAGFHAYAGRKAAGLRAVAYVCKLPTARLTERVKRQRRDAFAKGKTSYHDGSHFFPDAPRTYGKVVKRVKVPPLKLDARAADFYGL